MRHGPLFQNGHQYYSSTRNILILIQVCLVFFFFLFLVWELFVARDLIVNFVNVDVKISDNMAVATTGERSPTSSAVSTKSAENTLSSPLRQLVASPTNSCAQQTVSVAASFSSKTCSKINVKAKNKFGETALHIACKRGNLARIRECLR